MSDAQRGRNARHPEQIPRRGWRDIAWRVLHEAERDRITMLAAGVAFYALLALFPAIAAVVSIGGLVFDPYEASQQLRELSHFMPPDAARRHGDGADPRADRNDAVDAGLYCHCAVWR
ncbi:MAG: YihY/virulence factor BrkB family protein [Halomonadaceae bacterium]